MLCVYFSNNVGVHSFLKCIYYYCPIDIHLGVCWCQHNWFCSASVRLLQCHYKLPVWKDGGIYPTVPPDSDSLYHQPLLLPLPGVLDACAKLRPDISVCLRVGSG